MARRSGRFRDSLMLDAVGRHWARIARSAATADLDRLRDDEVRARALARRLDEVILTAETRLAVPRIGSSVFALPSGTDWSWRPDLWRATLARRGAAGIADRTRIDDQASVFHDCPLAEITLRQIRNSAAGDLAPFAVALDILGFSGSFLSLAIDLPQAAAEGLRKRHILRAEVQALHERPVGLYARLNIRHGPNTEQIVRDFSPDQPVAEFDLAHTSLDEKRVDLLWLDLIADRPAMNRIIYKDVTIARYPRGEF